MANLLEDLRWRGLIAACTNEAGLIHALDQPITLFCGFDPTAKSLHVGSLVPLITLERFKRAGHNVLGLIGGATGLIGDPSGKTAERVLADPDAVASRAASLSKQIAPFCSSVVNNMEWTSDVSVLAFLRDVGKSFSLSQMLQRDAVRSRLESNEGISFAEFSFMLLQAFDFLKLHEAKSCMLQIGGSDQWGNICSGVDLIRRKHSREAFALTMPLLTDSQGRKLGKTEAGAIWLDPALTTPWDFFQFWLNLPDVDAPLLLKQLSLASKAEIEELLNNSQARSARLIQRALAREMTELVHGADIAFSIRKASAFIFENADVEFSHVIKALPSCTVDVESMTLVDALTLLKLEDSKTKARASIKGGAVYVDGVRVLSDKKLADCSRGKYIVIRRSKQAGLLVVKS